LILDGGAPFASSSAANLAKAEDALSGIALGIEFPVKLFEALSDLLGIERGCILFPDQGSGLLLPWAAVGLDETSTRRIRVPADILGGLTKGAPALLSGEGLSGLRMFFSHRDFRTAAALRALPVPLGSLDSVYILALDRAKRPVPASIPGWEAIRDLLGARLSAYQAPFKAPAPLAEAQGLDRPAAIKARVAAAAAAARAKGLSSAVIVVPLENYIDAACDALPGADRIRSFEEAVAAIARIVPAPGHAFALPRLRAGILFCSSAKPDPGIFLAQLGSSLSRLLAGARGRKLAAEAVFDPASEASALDPFLRTDRPGDARSRG